MEISDWRTQIDSLDDKLVQLLNERAAAAVQIGRLKYQAGGPIYEPQRERDVLARVRGANPGPLTEEQLEDIYERIMDVMRALQRQN